MSLLTFKTFFVLIALAASFLYVFWPTQKRINKADVAEVKATIDDLPSFRALKAEFQQKLQALPEADELKNQLREGLITQNELEAALIKLFEEKLHPEFEARMLALPEVQEVQHRLTEKYEKELK